MKPMRTTRARQSCAFSAALMVALKPVKLTQGTSDGQRASLDKGYLVSTASTVETLTVFGVTFFCPILVLS